MTLPPNGDTSYGWVSTWGGALGGGLPYIVPGINGGIGNTNGSTLRSDPFAANAGDDLQFWFNYVTTDGAGFADYAWARLLDASNNEVALLFTARTKPTGSIIPGFGMPAPLATLLPASVPIIGGAPAWGPLGASSGTCYSTGCGYTGWVQANYSILAAGNYSVEYGVTNWSDTHFDSGLAFSGLTIEGAPVNTASRAHSGRRVAPGFRIGRPGGRPTASIRGLNRRRYQAAGGTVRRRKYQISPAAPATLRPRSSQAGRPSSQPTMPPAREPPRP